MDLLSRVYHRVAGREGYCGGKRGVLFLFAYFNRKSPTFFNSYFL